MVNRVWKFYRYFMKKDAHGLRQFLCRKDIHDQIRLNFLMLTHQKFQELSYPSF